MVCTFTKYYLGDQSKGDEMDGACGTHKEKRGSYRILMRKPKGKDSLEHLGLDRMIILN